MDSRELAQYALAQIELAYPAFLSDTGLPDKPLIKTMFYGTMVAAVQERPLEDAEAQSFLIYDLIALYRHYKNVLAQTILSRLN